MKAVTVSHRASSSRTTTIGILPVLLAAMCVAAFIIVAINPLYRNIDFSIHVTMPTLPSITIPHFWEYKVPAVQLPKIEFSIPPIEITLPHIDLSPAVQMVLQIGIARKYFSETILTLSFEISKQLFLFDKLLILNVYQIISSTVQTTWIVLSFVGKETIIVAAYLQQLLLFIGKTLWMIASAIWQKFTFGMNALFTLIEKPFIILGGYFEKCKPYLMILNDHANQSLHEMSGGVSSINTVVTDFTKPSK